MVFLAVKGLSARYLTSKGSVYAVEDVDFNLEEGESLGIAGESACGKSTLGLSIMRMLSGGTAKGEIIFDGESLLELSESKFDEVYRWKKIAMIFQGAMNSLDPVFTINEQFIEILKQQASTGKTLLVVHHDLSTVTQYFDQVILLNQRLIGFGDTQSVFTQENISKAYGGQLSILQKITAY